MTPRTLTPPPTDKAMWRRLMRLAHPDGAGEHDLFIWVKHVFEHVAGEPPVHDLGRDRARRQPPPHPTSEASDRLDFTDAFNKAEDHTDLTARAVGMAAEVGEPYARLLGMLRSCYPASEADVLIMRAQHQGASYKQLAYIAHLVGMSGAQRTRWYRIAESIPLSQRHAGHIIKGLQVRAGSAA